MIRKISKVISLLMLIGCLGFTVPAWGAEQTVTKPGSVTYEMQDIQGAVCGRIYGLSDSNGGETNGIHVGLRRGIQQHG